MADIISVEDIDVTAKVEQFAFEFGCNRGFAGARKAREPEDAPNVAIAHFALA